MFHLQKGLLKLLSNRFYWDHISKAQSFIVEALVRQGTRHHCRFSAGPVELDIFFSAQKPNLILMLALGSFLNYTFDSGQILGARPLIISRCNCGNISADLSLCYQVSGSQTV